MQAAMSPGRDKYNWSNFFELTSKEEHWHERYIVTRKNSRVQGIRQTINTAFIGICSAIDCLVQKTFALFSAKQSVRPDRILSCCFQATPFIKDYFSAIIDNGCIALRLVDSHKEFSNELRGLSLLHSIDQGSTENTSAWDKDALACLVNRMMSADPALRRFERMLNNEKSKDLLPTYKKLQNMAQLTESDYGIIQDKIRSLSAQSDNPAIILPESEKITVKEFALLMNTHEICQFLDKITFAVQDIPQINILQSWWKQLQKIYTGPYITKLRKTWLQANPPGTVFLGNFHTYVDQGFKIVPDMLLAHVYNGLIAHAAILDGKGKMAHISGVTTIRDPLLHAFHHTLTIDITPLLPKEISVEDQQILQKAFIDKFIKLAFLLRPPIHGAGIMEKASLLFFGHKQLAKQELSEIHLASEVGQFCTSYIAYIFLKALVCVNSKIEELGYATKIEHPFGKHENINHIDALRLLYLWKQSKLIKFNTFPPEIERAIPTGNTTYRMAALLKK